MLYDHDDYWFVKCYVFLYVCSPVLNSFIENSSRRQFLSVLVLFFVMQTYFGFFTNGVKWFNNGYSGLSFMGLYMLARYLRLYPIPLISKKSPSYFFCLYTLLAVLNGLAAYLVFMKGHIELYKRFYDYSNPIVIVQSLSFLLLFSNFVFKNKFVNWVAVSCFAVYLLHSCFMSKVIYDNHLKSFYDTHSGIFVFIFFSIFISLFFIISIILDKLRIFIYKKLFNK